MDVSMNKNTLLYLFEENVKLYRNNTLLLEKKDSTYEETSYLETHTQVKRFAAGLLTLGIKENDRVAIISENRNDWVISELGILYTGAISVPISVKLEPSELLFRLKHSECKMIVVSESNLEKIRTIIAEVPDLEYCILMDSDNILRENEILKDTVLESGDTFLKDREQKLLNRMASVTKESIANICYTSGTTSEPKGIMLSHENYYTNIKQAASLMSNISEKDRTLLILPMDHSFTHTAGIYGVIAKGASLASPKVGKTPLDTLRNISENINEIKPSFLLSVPALAKSFRYNIERKIKLKGVKTENLYQKALEFMFDYIAMDSGRKCRSLVQRIKFLMYDFFVFKPIREGFGQKLKFMIGGGALLDIELQKFFFAIGIPMYQGYGLSEASPILSGNMPTNYKLGSSGKFVGDLEVKICNEEGKTLPVNQTGEIVVRGKNIMAGYWRNEKSTKEVLTNGWLKTGDIGFLDTNKYLYVQGRIKSLLIGNDGEKYAPEAIEEAIVQGSKYIAQIMLFNNQNPYTVALVFPNAENIEEKLKETNHTIHTKEGQKVALKLIQKEIDLYTMDGERAEMFPQRWLPKAIGVLSEGFTEKNKFMNGSMKVRRYKVINFYRNRIDYLYSDDYHSIVNDMNRSNIDNL